jgi:response regulator NasT
MSKHLRIAVAEDERDTREYLQDLLQRLGHQVVTATNGRQLIEQCRALGPDLIIADVKMPDLDGIDAAIQVSADRPVPVILVSGYHDAELLQRAEADHIMAYLIKPVSQADVEAAIAMAVRRFEQYRAARQEASDLRQSLQDRKVIERGKGIVMRRLGVGEDEAYRRLRKVASDHNLKLVQVAQNVLKADEVFEAMEAK